MTDKELLAELHDILYCGIWAEADNESVDVSVYGTPETVQNLFEFIRSNYVERTD